MRTNRAVRTPWVIVIFLLLTAGIFYLPAYTTSRLFLGSSGRSEGVTLFVYPNPARLHQNPILHLESKIKGPFKATVFDMEGTEVMSKMIFHSNEENAEPKRFQTETPLDGKQLASGIYFGRLEGLVSDNKSIRENFRFTVVK